MDKSLRQRYFLFFAAVYFFSINGLASLANLSLSFLLKDRVHLTPSQAAYFQAVTLTAWVIKPFWGYVSDTFPLWGYRRKSYLIVTSLIAGLAWMSLGLAATYTVGGLLFWMTLAYFAYAFQDAVTDALMVEVGQPAGMTGKFQSIQWGAVYLAMLITALAGGYVSDQARSGAWSYQSVFLISALFPLITVGVIWGTVQEKKGIALEKVRQHFRETFRHKKVWMLSLFLFLWTFSPSIGTPFFYYAVDKLKFSGSFMGTTQAVASVTALFTSLILGKWLDHFPVRKVLTAAILAGYAILIFHLIYFYPPLVGRPEILRAVTLVTRVPFAFFDTLVFLMLANLAARSAPPDAGGSVFALFMSFYNLGQVGSGVLGGLLYPYLGLQGLILISAGFSLLALFVLPYLEIEEPLTALEGLIKRFVGLFSVK